MTKIIQHFTFNSFHSFQVSKNVSCSCVDFTVKTILTFFYFISDETTPQRPRIAKFAQSTPDAILETPTQLTTLQPVVQIRQDDFDELLFNTDMSCTTDQSLTTLSNVSYDLSASGSQVVNLYGEHLELKKKVERKSLAK